MKRPLALFCVSIITGITAAAFIRGGLGVIAAAAAAAAAAVWLAARGKRGARIVVALLGIALAFNISDLRRGYDDQIAECAGEWRRIEFTVTSASEIGGYNCRITARANIEGDDSGFFLRFYSEEFILPGTSGTADVLFAEYDFLERGFEAAEIEIYRYESDPLLTSVRRARLLASGAVKRALGGDEGAVAAGIAFGDKSDISSRIADAFRNSGASHLLVVSGLHISILLHLLTGALKRLRAPYPLILAAILLCCLAVLVMMDFSVSALRVSVMTAMVYGAGLLRRRADPATSLALAGAAILLADPSAAGDAGFWLSFSATFGLTTLLPAIAARLPERLFSARRPLRSLTNTLLGSLAASASILPALIAFGIDISIIAPFTNAAVIWMMPFALVLCVISACLYLLAPVGAASAAVFWAARTAVSIIIKVCGALGSIPGVVYDSTDAPIGLAAAAVIAGLAVWLLARGKAAKFALCGCATAAICAAALLAVYRASPRISVYNYRGYLSVVISQNQDCCVFVSEQSEYIAEDLKQLSRIQGYSYDYALSVSDARGSGEALAGIGAENIVLYNDMTGLAQEYGQLSFDLFENGGAAALVGEGGYQYAVWECGVSRVCLCFSAPQLPRELLDCDIIIVCREPPENIGAASGRVIAAGAEEGPERYEAITLNYLIDEWR